MRRNFSGPGRFIRLKSNQLFISQIDLMHFFSGGRYDNFDEPAPLDLSRGRLKFRDVLPALLHHSCLCSMNNVLLEHNTKSFSRTFLQTICEND